MSAGANHTCALDDTGVVCWGSYAQGQTTVPSLVIDPDGDGYQGVADALPLDATETLDTDYDGIGNNTDTDDDGDGLSDSQEATFGTNPLVTDTDGDDYSDSEETDYDTNPLDADSYPIIRGLNWGLIKTVLDQQNQSAD
ncbi:RCC1 domain-containing protein [Porticoccaceae bacterium]|nr:RCC1 domain-containing protein [Porticoccaceae bacterium]